MNPYEAVFKSLIIVFGTIGLGVLIGWIINKSEKR